MLMLYTQSSSPSFVSSLIILGLYQEVLCSMSEKVLVKRRSKCPITKCINESCSVIFTNCSGIKLKYFLYLKLVKFFGRNGKFHLGSVNACIYSRSFI